MKNLFFLLASCFLFLTNNAQQTYVFADSVRKAYHIPELAYAVVSSTEVIEIHALGIKRVNTTHIAEINDRFRIGSNTKAITGYIAAWLVKQKNISWNTPFFDVFPELKSSSNKAYHSVTLLDLLTFRTRLYPYTYTYATPIKDQFTGNEEEQRYQFTRWFFQQKPVAKKGDIHFSNLGYIAAGLMLEKSSGKSYKELATDIGQQLGMNIGFGMPNATDTLQPWGHNSQLIPEPPNDDYKLNWLLAAGNINLSLPDYTKFIQLQLQGLQGKSTILTQQEFQFLHYGLPTFSVGWFWKKDENNQTYSYNTGNPGTFLSKVYVYRDIDRAYILLCNAQTEEANTGLDLLYTELKQKYNK